MDTFDILVIILSVTLAVFLLLAIVATSYIIKLLKKMNSAADSAKVAAENVEAITGSIKNVANGTVVVSAFSTLFDKIKNRSSGSKEK